LDNNIIYNIKGLDKLVNLQWLDLSFNLIEKIEDFQIKSAERYGCEAVCGATWEILSISQDDTPIFGKIKRILPPKK